MKASKNIADFIADSLFVVMLCMMFLLIGSIPAQSQTLSQAQAQTQLQNESNQAAYSNATRATAATGAVTQQALPVSAAMNVSQRNETIPFHNYWYFVLMSLLSLSFILAAFINYIRQNVSFLSADTGHRAPGAGHRTVSSGVRSF